MGNWVRHRVNSLRAKIIREVDYELVLRITLQLDPGLWPILRVWRKSKYASAAL